MKSIFLILLVLTLSQSVLASWERSPFRRPFGQTVKRGITHCNRGFAALADSNPALSLVLFFSAYVIGSSVSAYIAVVYVSPLIPDSWKRPTLEKPDSATGGATH